MITRLGTDASTLSAVALATVGICLTLLMLLRFNGARSLSTTSIADVACMIAVGAVVGRTTLLATPTLANGIAALVLLFGFHRLLAVLIRRPRWARVLTRPAVVLMADGRIDEKAVRSAQLSDDALRQRLRLAGITNRNQVAFVVLERTGEISVLAKSDVEAWLMIDVAPVGDDP